MDKGDNIQILSSNNNKMVFVWHDCKYIFQTYKSSVCHQVVKLPLNAEPQRWGSNREWQLMHNKQFQGHSPTERIRSLFAFTV